MMLPIPRHSLKLLPALALLLAAPSCGTSSTPAADAGAAVPDAGADAPVSPRRSFWVYSQAPLAGGVPTPLPDAVVAFDPPGGPRQEVTTGPDGLASLTGEITGGMITVAAPGHATFTALDVSPEALSALPPNNVGKPSTDMVVALTYTGTDRTVQLSGKLTGKQAPDSPVTLTTRGLQARVGVAGGTYSLRVPKGLPLFVVGLEGTGSATGREVTYTGARFFKVEGPAPTADTTLDLDVSQGALPSATSTFKVELPGGASGPLGGSSIAFCQTQSADSGLLLGITAKSAPSADLASFTCELRAASADISPEALQTLVAVQTADGAVSVAGALGPVPDGTVWKDLLPPPALTIATVKRTDPIPTEGLPKEATTCQLNLTYREQLVWAAVGPFGRPCPSAITLPEPPSGTTLPATLRASLIGLADPVEVPGRKGDLFFKRVSVSRTFTVTTR
ncbi:MAG TPA: hypothetical protein PLR99_16000 [Polyangiaceae bacterium]|nr:hypothetical protein [Polyangiaceae bacterium]